jgi:hypothetical protein
MPFGIVTITSQYAATPVVSPGDLDGARFTVVNSSETETVYLGDNPAIQSTDATGLSPLGPLNAVPFDGQSPIYAISASGDEAVLWVFGAGAVDWAPSPVQAAVQIDTLGLATFNEQVNQNTAIPGNIAVTGVPLLNLSTPITSNNSLVIPGGGTAPGVGQVAIPQPAYDCFFQVEIAAGATIPWLAVEFTWIDAATLSPISNETFYLGATNNGVNVYGGRGQTKGDLFSFQMVNLDPSKAITVSYAILQNSRIPPRTEWTTQAFNGITGLTNAAYDPTSGQILQFSQSITNGNSVALSVPLYTGKMKVSMLETGQSGRILFRNQAVNNLLGSLPGFFDSGPIAASAGFVGDVSMPNASCRMDVFNTGNAAATFAVSLVAEEY